MLYILVDGEAHPKWRGGWWEEGLELIRFDPANPEALPEQTYILENDGGYLALYNVRTSWNAQKRELRIEYHREDNQHLFDERPELTENDIICGVHTLTIENGTNCGPSVWQADGDPQCCGPGWRRVDGEPRERGIRWAIQRVEQGRFRQGLLAMDKCCALTGETCETALEAAHIVPVHRHGEDELSNGILLRADIHRLFDAVPPKFEICPNNGNVSIDSDFCYGSSDLRGARIPNDVRERIEEALRKRQELFGPNGRRQRGD